MILWFCNKEHQTVALQGVCGTLMHWPHTGTMSHSYQEGSAAWSDFLSMERVINRGRQQNGCGGSAIPCCWTLQSSLLWGFLFPFTSTLHQPQQHLSCYMAWLNCCSLESGITQTWYQLTFLYRVVLLNCRVCFRPWKKQECLFLCQGTGLIWALQQTSLRQGVKARRVVHTQLLLLLKLKSSSGTFKWSLSQGSLLSQFHLT